MLIVCPSCASRYSIDDDKIGASGRTVRCASCRTGFFVSLADNPASSEVAAPPPAPAQVVAEVAAPAAPRPSATAAPPAPVPQPSADDDLAAQWLAEMEKDGTPVPDAEPEDARTQDEEPEEQAQVPQDLDQGSLDALFEAEMAAARLEADAAATTDAAAQGGDLPATVTGWRRFLPAGRDKSGKKTDLPAKPEKKAARSAARRPSRFGTTSANGKPSALARLKGPVGVGLVGTLVLVGLLLQRHTVVRLLPPSAGVFSAVGLGVNLRGLEFADVRSTSQSEGDARFLIVEGGVRNVKGDTTPVPQIEVSLRSEDGRVLYTWTTEPPRKSLKSGEALHFRTRLATPPEAGRNVEVRFTDKLQSARAGS